MPNVNYRDEIANDRDSGNASYKGKLQDNKFHSPDSYLGRLKPGSGYIGLSGKSHGKDIGVSGQKRGL